MIYFNRMKWKTVYLNNLCANNIKFNLPYQPLIFRHFTFFCDSFLHSENIGKPFCFIGIVCDDVGKHEDPDQTAP